MGFLAARCKKQLAIAEKSPSSRKSGSPNAMGLSELQAEAQKWPFLRMRSKKYSQKSTKTLDFRIFW